MTEKIKKRRAVTLFITNLRSLIGNILSARLKNYKKRLHFNAET